MTIPTKEELLALDDDILNKLILEQAKLLILNRAKKERDELKKNLMKRKSKKLLFSSYKEQYIGTGPVRRLNPRIAWDELDEDIKNAIRAEEKKEKKIFFDIPDSPARSLIQGNFTADQVQKIHTVHNNLQDEIKRISGLTEGEISEEECPQEYIRAERKKEYHRVLKYLCEFNFDEDDKKEQKLNTKIQLLVAQYFKKIKISPAFFNYNKTMN